MPTYDYQQDVAAAQELIVEFGMNVTLRDPRRTIDPNTGLVTTDTDYDQALTAIKTPVEDEKIDGVLIKTGDQMLTIAAPLDLPLSKAAQFLIGSETWSIESLEVVEPGGVAIIYRFQVRKVR